jgi:hypothetical protein
LAIKPLKKIVLFSWIKFFKINVKII